MPTTCAMLLDGVSPSQPKDRADFEIAIICTLPLEASAVSVLFDKWWDAALG